MKEVPEFEVERRLVEFKEALLRSGVKLTHQRLEIFREVARSLEHPNADQVLCAVRERMATVSLDTVYRTLSLATELGLLSTLGLRAETLRFDANTAQHHHYVCDGCGMTRDFECPPLDRLSLPPELLDFGTVESRQLEVRGLCLDCQTARQSPSVPPDSSPPDTPTHDQTTLTRGVVP